MKAIYDTVSKKICKKITKTYSTSFSLGIYMLHKSLHDSIYAIYGFVRLADEIVDSFHGYDKKELLERFRQDTYQAIDGKISLNPVLNAFQTTVNQYQIPRDMIETFLCSMEMDLEKKQYTDCEYQQYILGSAEVVGLMCLKVFVEGDQTLYHSLDKEAMALGSAFQKVNFLRDVKNDYVNLGRTYFPELDLNQISIFEKIKIEETIEKDFRLAREGIKRLPAKARFGVYTAFIYYYQLFRKIKSTTPETIMTRRIRISNSRKIYLLLKSYFKYNLRLI